MEADAQSLNRTVETVIEPLLEHSARLLEEERSRVELSDSRTDDQSLNRQSKRLLDLEATKLYKQIGKGRFRGL